jgi:hypothetical protein
VFVAMVRSLPTNPLLSLLMGAYVFAVHGSAVGLAMVPILPRFDNAASVEPLGEISNRNPADGGLRVRRLLAYRPPVTAVWRLATQALNCRSSLMVGRLRNQTPVTAVTM